MAGRAGLGPMAEVEACIGRWRGVKGEKDGDVWSEWAGPGPGLSFQST